MNCYTKNQNKIRKVFICLFSLLLILYPNKSLYTQNQEGDFKILLDREEKNIYEILSQYIQFESLSNEEKDAGEWLRDLCAGNGLYITQMGETDGNYNFTASLFPLSEFLPNIVFLHHIDVVPGGDFSLWKHPPFSGVITETDIWGRGVFDNKGPGIMQLFSIIQFLQQHERSEIPFNVSLLAVSCEEILCDGGTRFVIENYLKRLNPSVVIGEGPTEISNIIKSSDDVLIFGISVVHKRAFWIRLDIDVPTFSHGSIAPEEYATKEMIVALNRLLKKKPKAVFTNINVRLLKNLGTTQKGVKGFMLRHPVFFKPIILPQLRKEVELFTLFANTMTLTGLNSHNEIVNVIPDKMTALMDCRLLPSTSSELFLKKMKKRLKNDKITISVLTEMPEMKPSDANNKYYKHMADAIVQNYPGSTVLSAFLPSYNDVGFFRAKGIQGFTATPVVLDRDHLSGIHDVDERMPVSALKKGKDTYFTFLKNCLAEHYIMEENKRPTGLQH
jgi:acetylornithine deacetylase/succinyl-diaminopimelate desuccinylase-like protein